MKKILFIITVSVIYLNANGQFYRDGNNYRISVNAGYGFYQLNDLHDFQSQIAKRYPPLSIEEVEQFPFSLGTSISK